MAVCEIVDVNGVVCGGKPDHPSGGMCSAHKKRLRKKQDMTAPVRGRDHYPKKQRARPLCTRISSVDGQCTRTKYKKGLCRTHWLEIARARAISDGSPAKREWVDNQASRPPTMHDRINALINKAVTRAGEQVEALKVAADVWHASVEELVLAKAARGLGLESDPQAEEKSRDALANVLAACEALEGMPELLRVMFGESEAARAERDAREREARFAALTRHVPPIDVPVVNKRTGRLVPMPLETSEAHAETVLVDPRNEPSSATVEQPLPPDSIAAEPKRDVKPVNDTPSLLAPIVKPFPLLRSRTVTHSLLVVHAFKERASEEAWLDDYIGAGAWQWEELPRTNAQRLFSLAQKIKGGSHCAVILAVGNMSHPSKNALHGACKAAGVPIEYIREPSTRTLYDACTELERQLARVNVTAETP